MRKNKFEDNNHLKSIQMKENLEFLTETPTNNIGGLYIIEPEYIVQDPEIPGEVTREADFTQDDSATDTTGLFDDDGTILTIEPPGDTSYVLGPMSSMWYAWGNFTTIGYIRESDRRMVNLGRITGQLSAWDGETNFTSYGQLTLEQAKWFRDTPKYLNGYDNYRAFYPGPPSNTPDQYGRYLCTITGTPKPTTITPDPRRVPPVTGGPEDVGFPWGNNPTPPKPTVPSDPPLDWGNAPRDPIGDLVTLGIAYVLAKALIAALGMAAPYAAPIVPKVVNVLKNLKPKPVYRPTQSRYPTTPKPKDPRFRIDGPLNPKGTNNRPPSPSRGRGMGDRWEGPLSNSYQPKGELIAEGLEELPVELIPIIHNILVDMGGYTSENIDKLIAVIEKYSKPVKPVKESKQDIIEKYEKRRKILRDIKRPYVLPEQKKVKYHFKLKRYRNANRTINSDLMKQAEVPTSFKRPDERLWGKYEKEKNARNSQDKKNVVLDHLGGGDHFLDYILETGREKGNSILYNNFGGKKPKKVVSREQLKGDVLLFIADETGKKTPILQSKINQDLDFEFSKDLFEMYFQEQETLQADKDPLFKKVSNKLKTEIDYENKPSKMGYPNTPPPEMVNGWHPEYGKDKGYYNKLDPVSAISMPKTGNPEIDRKVRAAAKKKKVEENLKNSYLETKSNWKDEIVPLEKNEVLVEIEEPLVDKVVKIAKEKKVISKIDDNDLNEGMTSSGLFSVTLESGGEDILTSIAPTSDQWEQYGSLPPDGTSINFGGDNSVPADSYDDTWSSTHTQIVPLDTTAVDTISMQITVGSGYDAPLPGDSLYVLYYAISPSGEQSYVYNVGLLGEVSSSGTYNFTLPKDAQYKRTFLQLYIANSRPGQDYYDSYIVPKMLNQPLGNIYVYSSAMAKDIFNYVNSFSPNIDDDTKDLFGGVFMQRWGYVTETNGNPYGRLELPSWSVPPPQWHLDAGGTYEEWHGYANTRSDRIWIYDLLHSTFSNPFSNTPKFYSINNVGYKRRTPMNVFVPLDSPEASAFIRTDPIMQGLSAAERYKKLEDMLNAGDEYILKALGIQSMSARPAETQMPPTWQQAAEVDYGEDLTPLSDNPYGTELGQIAMAGDMDMGGLGLLGMGIEGIAAAVSLGVAGLMATYNMSKEMATWFVNKYGSDPYGQDQAGPETTGDNPEAKNLTPQQQAEVEAAGKELRDAQRALNDAEESGNQTQIDMAKERVDRASKRRQSLRRKHREENRHRKENYEPVGKVLAEKKRLKSPKDLQNKIPGYYDGKPSPLGFPDNPPPKLVNGMHPDLVDGKKVADRFNKLDPESAKAMPPTGNPHIDKKVRAAAKKKK